MSSTPLALPWPLREIISRAQRLADDLEQRFPEDTFARFTYVPVLRASAALGRGKPSDSVEQLRVALPYELAANGLNFNFYLGGLHSGYVRGEAFLAAHRYAEAVTEFQKLLDHRGIVGADPIGALAHLQMGRAFAASGDTVKAAAAYQEFLAHLEGCGPGRPDSEASQGGIRAAATRGRCESAGSRGDRCASYTPPLPAVAWTKARERGAAANDVQY